MARCMRPQAVELQILTGGATGVAYGAPTVREAGVTVVVGAIIAEAAPRSASAALAKGPSALLRMPDHSPHAGRSAHGFLLASGCRYAAMHTLMAARSHCKNLSARVRHGRIRAQLAC